MEPHHRALIEKHRNQLTRLIDIAGMIPLLLNKKIFTDVVIKEIMAISNPYQRNYEFLQHLCMAGPNAFDEFFEILVGRNQMEAARLLKPEEVPKEAVNDAPSVIASIVAEGSVENPIALPRSPQIRSDPPSFHDNINNNTPTSSSQEASGHTLSTPPVEEVIKGVQLAQNMMTGINIYPMDKNPRGYCIIFNNVEFNNGDYPSRTGSDSEAVLLSDVFKQLYFDVIMERNVTYDELFRKLEGIARKPDLRNHNALVVIILTHGKSGCVITSDNIFAEYQRVINIFDNTNCPNLRCKPKMFFFNSCRGERHDRGSGSWSYDVDCKAVPDSCNNSEALLPRLPINSDIMICNSTLDGYVSWRNELTGTWFGTALARALMQYSCDTELHHILTLASQYLLQRTTDSGCKQAMEWTYRGWNKFLYFNPGLEESSFRGNNSS